MINKACLETTVKTLRTKFYSDLRRNLEDFNKNYHTSLNRRIEGEVSKKIENMEIGLQGKIDEK